jgi:hypothetical protein
LIPTSWGELLDKISILEIKLSKLTNQQSLKNVHHEYAQLKELCIDLPKNDAYLVRLISELSKVNQALWDTEDKIRKKEGNKLFDEEFIALARSVYCQNDKRAAIKRELNSYLKSELVEEKSYSDY